MINTKTNTAVKDEAVDSKSVQIFIQSRLLILSGSWQWDLHSNAVFCSDVILSIPYTFRGTKGIIHPDDLSGVAAALSSSCEGICTPLQFRMITTYGEVKTLKGEGITVSEADDILHPEKIWEEELTQHQQQGKELSHLFIQKQTTHYAEKILQTGTWYHNTITHETWYSDAVFAIYSLPPQSLNAHLNTFASYIHPDDKDVVNEAFAKAYINHAPLHIEYRIVTADGKEKMILQITRWIYSQTGEHILTGIVQDRTEEAATERHIKHWEHTLKFHQELLLQNEENLSAANWHINLLTKKTAYCDNYYRIYGLKPQSVLPGINVFINFVHPDDRTLVLEAYRRIQYEHIAPLVEYRIIRPDGTIRHLRQKGKVTLYGDGELIMAGTIQDITHIKTLEQKVSTLNQELLLRNTATRQR